HHPDLEGFGRLSEAFIDDMNKDILSDGRIDVPEYFRKRDQIHTLAVLQRGISMPQAMMRGMLYSCQFARSFKWLAKGSVSCVLAINKQRFVRRGILQASQFLFDAVD